MAEVYKTLLKSITSTVSEYKYRELKKVTI